MKKLLFLVLFSCFLIPTLGFSGSSKTIKDFHDNDHGVFLDTIWVRPRQIYDEWSNGSRFMTSNLMVTYNRKKVPYPIFESLKDYIGDHPISWSHKANFHTVLHQLHKKEYWPFLKAWAVREANENLQVYNKQYNFVIGTFDKWGRFNVSHYNRNGQVNVDLWSTVYFDPWTNEMFVKATIEKESERRTRTNYAVSADGFYFRFKNDNKDAPRFAKLSVLNLPGFKQPAVVFNYAGKVLPIGKEAKYYPTQWTEQTISFDINYRYDERLLWVDKNKLVHLEMSYEDFLNQ